MIDVIIPAYRDIERLRFCLLGLCEQTYSGFSVVVVNDGGDRKCSEVVDRFSSKLNIRYEYLSPPSKNFRAAMARNVGILVSKSSRVICLDQDMVPAPELVEMHMQYGDSPVIVCGIRKRVNRGFAESLSNLVDLKWQDILSNTYKDDDRYRKHPERQQKFLDMVNPGKKYHELCISCNISYPTRESQLVGGFWEEMVGWGREDAEFALRLCRVGCTTLLDPNILAYHLDHSSNATRKAIVDNERRYQQTVNSSVIVRNKIF